MILHFHDTIQQSIQQWNLPVQEARELYLLLIQLTRAEKRDSLAFGDLIQYFESFTNDKFTPEATNLATETIINSLKSTMSSYSERRTLSRALSKQTVQDPQLSSLISLLQLLVAGDIDGFNTFKSNPSNVTLLTSQSISMDQLMHSLKLLILCNLASSSHVLSYETIAEALQVSPEDVEEWVIEAISNKLIEASMDQFNKVVLVR